MLKRLALIFTALVMTLALSSCGSDEESSSRKKKKSSESSSQADMSKYDDMAGEYECTGVITNFNAMDAGYKDSDTEARFKGTVIKLDGDKLEMEGNTFEMKAKNSENLYYNYMVSIVDSGFDGGSHNSDRKFCDEAFEGPVYFMFAKEGTDQGLEELVDKDTIEMYFSPAGTQDWYFALDFKRK